MKRGRIGKKQREADLRHKRRAQVAGEWLTAAKTPPKAIPVGAMARLASVDRAEPLVPHSYPVKRASLGKRQEVDCK
jgi:hypothetical protein